MSEPICIQIKRRTGRTTRMIEEAKRLAKEGKAVYVMTYSQDEAKRLRHEFGPGPHGIKVETPNTMRNFDWRTMRLHNAHPNCEVLVDHHALELEFVRVFEMWTRFDGLIPTSDTREVHGLEPL